MSYHKIKNRSGFSLVELLIAVSIIGILSAIAIPNYMTYLDNSRARSLKVEIGNIQAAHRACTVGVPLTQCDSLSELDVEIDTSVYPYVRVYTYPTRVCFEIRNKEGQSGCYDSQRRKSTTLEDILNTKDSTGKCSSSALCR